MLERFQQEQQQQQQLQVDESFQSNNTSWLLAPSLPGRV
jgi:hypothetical protein